MNLMDWVIVIPSIQCGEGSWSGARYLGRSIEWMRHDFYELIRLGEAACVPDRCSDAAAFIASRSMPIDNFHYVGLFHSLSSRKVPQNNLTAVIWQNLT